MVAVAIPRQHKAGRQNPEMIILQAMVPEVDMDFLDYGAERFQVSRAEFLRRCLHDVRLKWLESGLYKFPNER